MTSSSQSTLPETIKALQLQENQTLKLVDIPLAGRDDIHAIADDQVLLKVRAVGLNPGDWKYALTPAGSAGTISGCDAAGDVVKVGANVTHLKVGDRAAGLTQGGNDTNNPNNGAYSEYVLLPSSSTLKLPNGLSYTEAAGIPAPHMTAVQSLYLRLGLALPSAPTKEKKGIVVWGGSTAVGHHALQLASLSGYKVYVAASPQVADDLKALGATEVFDYKDQETPAKIQAAAAKDGIVIDTALDTISTDGTTDLVAASLSTTSSKNKIITLNLPANTKNLPANTTAEMQVVFTILGSPIKFGPTLVIPVKADDVEGAREYVRDELPKLLEGWQTGKGSPKLKGQKLTVKEGGLESIPEGLKIMKEGKYGREKIVYNIA